MEIEKIVMPIEKAKAEHKKYIDLLKKKKDSYLKDMKNAMYQLSKGRELLDIYVVMEKTGIDKFNKPKMAIARADWKQVHFHKKDAGRGFFSDSSGTWASSSKGHIDMQPNTFPHWARQRGNDGKEVGTREWDIAEKELKAKVPIIPSHMTPEGDLSGYYILWEVVEWETVPVRDDPILLKRITENLFVILGAWDVTDLEQSIIRGR